MNAAKFLAAILLAFIPLLSGLIGYRHNYDQSSKIRQDPSTMNNLHKIITKRIEQFSESHPNNKINKSDWTQKIIDRLRVKTNIEEVKEIILQKHILQLCHDLEDIQLLKNKSILLIEKYQHYLKSLLNKYIRKNYQEDINPEQYYYLIENINALLLEKLLTGKLDFKGKSLLSVYLYRVMQNLVIDELRKYNNQSKTISINDFSFIDKLCFSKQEFQEQVVLYPTLLDIEFQDTKEKHQFIFLSKIIHRICLTEQKLHLYFPSISTQTIDDLLNHFGQNYALMPKTQMWLLIENFWQKLTGTQRSSRTLKTWFKCHRNNILRYYFKKAPLQIPDNSTGELERLLDEFFERIVHQF